MPKERAKLWPHTHTPKERAKHTLNIRMQKALVLLPEAWQHMPKANRHKQMAMRPMQKVKTVWLLVKFHTQKAIALGL